MPPKKPIPIRRSRSSRDFRAEALKRLEQKWKNDNEEGEFDPSGEPIVTPLLKSCGLPAILEALRAHDEEDSRKFADFYDELSAKDLQYLTLEEISFACGIGSLRLAEVSTSAMIVHGEMRWKLMLSAGMPAVVETMLKQAKKPKGLADREWALKSGGVLPMPKGAQIAIQNNVAGEKKDEPEKVPLYLDSGQRLRLIHDAVEQRRLPSPPSVPLELGGRLDHMQAETAEIIDHV